MALIDWMVENGYQDAKTLLRRRDEMQAWIDNPQLMEADADADYAAVIEIDLENIKEPIVACPNDPDDVKLMSDVQNSKIDEVFIGSCMTNIGHYRAAGKVLEQMGNVPTRLWIAPPTKMDERQLIEEGYYSIYGRVGARTEMPGCSLCMGNQARVADGATVFSTSTRNFPNRLGNGANVYLGSAELAAVCSVLGRIPTVAEYMDAVAMLDTMSDDVYRYLQFDEMADYKVEEPKKLSDIGVAVA
jgi:aconitate hydratase 2/2-methylisocitrate dehydratase